MRIINKTLLAFAISALSLPLVKAQSVVEYFWDTDPGVGKGQVLQSPTGTTATVTTFLDVGSLPVGIHTLGIRALNNSLFSSTYHRQFYVLPTEEKFSRLEYSIDNDVPIGQGTALEYTHGNTIGFADNLPVGNLPAGMHTIYLRAISTNHHSLTYSRSFYVPEKSYSVNAIEYYFDTDPGVGKATRMSATIEGDSLNMAFDINTDGLTDGVHKIGIRTLTDGTWSATKVRQFLVRSVLENDVIRLEYFWNNDPGAGNGIVVDITPGKEVNVDFEADMTDLSEGTHTLGVRAQSGSQGWSLPYLTTGIEFEGWDALQEYLNSLIDTEDNYAGNVYQRQFLNKDWQALYLPFSLSYSDWSAHFDVARINAFYQYDDDEDGLVDRQVLEAIIVRPGNGNLKANHPYLIRAKSKDTFQFNVNPSKVEGEQINSISCSTVEAKYTFTGNYSDMTGLKSAERYRIRGGSLSIPESDEEVLPPYRWYLTIDDLGNQLQPSAAKVGLRIVGDETPTIIGNMETDVMTESQKAFDISGRQIDVDASLSTLPKGIYIINNKKFIVK